MSDGSSVVSDTGPLITLEKMGDGYSFIRKLYRRIVIPRSVLTELAQGQFVSPAAYLKHYGVEDLFEVVDVGPGPPLPEVDDLDSGERDAIRLALSRRLTLLIEEEAGRRVAQALGLSISGIAGQIFKAACTGVIPAPEAEKKLGELLAAGRINRRVYRGLLEAVEKLIS